LADAGAQSTVAAPITNAQTSVTLGSATGFPAIASGGQVSVVILPPGYDPLNPLALGYEYQQVNGISGNVLTFGPGGGGASRAAFAGTTPRSFLAGATVAAALLAEDIAASSPWKYDDQSAAGVGQVNIPASGTIPPSILGIPFRHIEITWVLRSALVAVTDTLNLRINSDIAQNYFYTRSVLGSSYSTTGVQNPNPGFVQVASIPGASSAANAYGSGTIKIPMAFLTGIQRTVECRNVRQDTGNAPTPEFASGVWVNTANAVTSVSLLTNGALFAGGTITTYLVP
jgi:hypothetical protein